MKKAPEGVCALSFCLSSSEDDELWVEQKTPRCKLDQRVTELKYSTATQSCCSDQPPGVSVCDLPRRVTAPRGPLL